VYRGTRWMILVTALLVVAYLAFERNDVDGHHSGESPGSGLAPYSDWIPEEGVIEVATDATSPEQLRNVFDAVRDTRTDGDWWRVRISCASVPRLRSVDPLLATGRFANTLRGAEEAGLPSADDEVFDTTGRADCDPLPVPAGAVTADDVFAAVERAELPVVDPEDGSAMCHQLGCLQRTHTAHFTVIVWPSAGAARSWADRPVVESTLLGPVTTVQLEPSGFGPEDDPDAFENAVAGARADLSSD
jgi:hypothetical protein